MLRPVGCKYSPNYELVLLMNFARIKRIDIGREGYRGIALYCSAYNSKYKNDRLNRCYTVNLCGDKYDYDCSFYYTFGAFRPEYRVFPFISRDRKSRASALKDALAYYLGLKTKYGEAGMRARGSRPSQGVEIEISDLQSDLTAARGRLAKVEERTIEKALNAVENIVVHLGAKTYHYESLNVVKAAALKAIRNLPREGV